MKRNNITIVGLPEDERERQKVFSSNSVWLLPEHGEKNGYPDPLRPTGLQIDWN